MEFIDAKSQKSTLEENSLDRGGRSPVEELGTPSTGGEDRSAAAPFRGGSPLQGDDAEDLSGPATPLM
jgi:hypothetical protein